MILKEGLWPFQKFHKILPFIWSIFVISDACYVVWLQTSSALHLTHFCHCRCTVLGITLKSTSTNEFHPSLAQLLSVVVFCPVVLGIMLKLTSTNEFCPSFDPLLLCQGISPCSPWHYIEVNLNKWVLSFIWLTFVMADVVLGTTSKLTSANQFCSSFDPM